VLIAKKNFVKTIIEGATIERQQFQAQQALDQLMAVLETEIQPVILAA